jgi:hypothetical protein
MGRACSKHVDKLTAYRILVGNQEEIDHWENLEASERIILK